jgi:hypothetical protein
MSPDIKSDRPIAVFRRRKRPLRRWAWEAGGGFVLATVVYALPYLYTWQAWIWLCFALGAAAATIYAFYRAFRARQDTVTLYPDRITWRDYRGRRKEALYSQIVDMEPDRQRHRHLVRVRGAGGFWISPETERFTELWRRLGAPQNVRGPMPWGRERWQALDAYGPHPSQRTRSKWILLASLLLIGCVIALSPILFVICVTVGFANIRKLMSSAYERVEITADEIVYKSWIPRVQRRVPLGAIVGACLYDAKTTGTSVIDTDYGEIRFPSSFDGADNLVREAERLGAARYGLAEVLRNEGS